MGIIRAAQSPTAIHRSFKITRLNRRDVSQIRTLWWWGKKSHGWWSSEHENMEERLRRHQALMMHRYSKAMKRRSIWDRDDSPSYSAWRMRGCRASRDMSSTESMRAKVEERDGPDPTPRKTWQEFHKDFESFKRAVDKAIERDPYGTLFGRRLRSPETANNSSWTSWSWIFDPKEIKKEAVPETEKPQGKHADSGSMKAEPTQQQPVQNTSAGQQPQPSVVHSSMSSKTSTTLKSSQSFIFQDRAAATTQYIYDPISGRKIPQSTATTTPPPKPKHEQSTTIKTVQQQQATPSKGFIQSIFGEHGVDIPVKTYKPPKVYGYTGEAKPTPKTATTGSTSSQPKAGFETSRKRQYDDLRLRTIGNNIDATNFNCEPWNNKEPEPPKPMEPEEKRVRISPAPSEDFPLFSGTTYASRSEDLSPPKSDWLSKEGFRARQGMTMPSLKASVTQARPVESHVKMQPALDRANASATDIPVKKFGSKLQPAMDRIVPPSRSEPMASKSIQTQVPVTKKETSTSEDKIEDMDLLRASDVRAAAKASRVTKQATEDQKKLDRKELEKDFVSRQQAEIDPVHVPAKPVTSTSGSGLLGNVLKHVKQYPQGIVAKTLQNMGMKEGAEKVETTGSETTKAPSLSNAGVNNADRGDKHLDILAMEMKSIYDQEFPQDALKAQIAMAKTEVSRRKAPAFSEPTVKPGVTRNLEIERHTRDFEPKIANIVDKAKGVKRELFDVSRGLGGVINERAITAVANRDLIMREMKPTSVVVGPSQSKQPALEHNKPALTFDSPFILLMYNRTIGDVEATSLQNLMGQASAGSKINAMAAIGSLNNPNAFVKHFVDLDKNGYELASGGGDILIFQKRQIAPVKDETADAASSPLLSTSGLRSTIACAEAAAQPAPQSDKNAARVLDELPTTIPMPGPAAPTAPTASRLPNSSTIVSGSTSTVAGIPLASISNRSQIPPNLEAQPQASSTPRKSRSRISRQEQVFSGQVRLPPQTTSLPDPEHFQKQNPVLDATPSTSQHEQQYQYTSSEPTLGFFARLRRGVRRVILTALAFGAGAYGIGVVAEGLSAKAQIAQGETGGPMKRLVLDDGRQKAAERQRAGIFSTESSR